MRSTFEYNLTFAEFAAVTRSAGRRFAHTSGTPWQVRTLSLLSVVVFGAATWSLAKLASQQHGAGANLVIASMAGLFAAIVLTGLSSHVRRNLVLRRCLS